MFGLGILTVSTSGAQGQRDDTSGQAIREALEPQGYHVIRYEIVSDDKEVIADKLAQWADASRRGLDRDHRRHRLGTARRDPGSVFVDPR